MPLTNMRSARNLKTEERKQLAVAMKTHEGMSVKEIAEKLGVTESCVHKYIRSNQELSISRRLDDGQKIFEEQLMKLDRIEFDAERAYERSCQDRKRITKTTGESTEKEAIDEKVTEMTEGQYGDPRFLHIRLSIVKQRCELLGLNAPIKIAGEVNSNTNVNVQVGVNIQAIESMSNVELLEYLNEVRSTLTSPTPSTARTDSPPVVPALPAPEATGVPPNETP